MKIRAITILLATYSLTLTACAGMGKPATREPEFYPNDHYKNVGQTVAHQDTRYCMSMADEYIQDPEKWKSVLGSTAEGAVLGTATGAVGGAIVSKAGRGAGIGAATGAMLGLYQGLKKSGEANPDYERFVEHCLQEKGYQVYGWR